MLTDLGEQTWQDWMKKNPSFARGEVFVFRSKGKDYDGYIVAVFEQPDPTGPSDICRKGIFWDKKLALVFAQQLVKQS